MMTSRMSRIAATCVFSAFSAALLVSAAKAGDASRPRTPGLGDPGQLTEVLVDSGRTLEGVFTLDGQDARQQLVVTGKYATGQLRDLTSAATYEVAPEGVVTVEKSGLVIPRSDGTATITAKTAQGPPGTIKVTVIHFGNDPSVNFPNQIVPIFTKLGCNSGGCHGKASGQNGFKLSLLGFEPTEDFEHLVKEGRGRRLFPGLARQEPAAAQADRRDAPRRRHAAGSRFAFVSVDASLDPAGHALWQRRPDGGPHRSLSVRADHAPERRAATARDRPLHQRRHRRRDGHVKFEPNNPEMAEVSASGLVKTLDLTGDVAVMARYQGQVGVFRASMPLGVPVESTPPPKNFIDELVFKKLKNAGRAAVGRLRRRDVLAPGRGRHRRPAADAEETQKFLADADPAKRDKWIDTLLASTDYADYFRQQVEFDSAEQAPQREPTPAARASSTTGFATA